MTPDPIPAHWEGPRRIAELERRINRVINILNPENDGDFQIIQMLKGEAP